MSTQDDTAPATKADIAAVMESIGKLYDANEEWKDEILGANEQWKDEIIGHFDFVTENQKHDYQDIFKDRTEQHEDHLVNHEVRIGHLEKSTGIAVA